MTRAKFYVVHARAVAAIAAAPLFVIAWWWASVATPWPVLAPAGAFAGTRVVIDAGHGGVDPGAVGSGGTLEKDVVLQIALRLKPLFEEAGIHAALVREDDRSLSDGTGSLKEQKRVDLARRVEFAAEQGADIYLSLHANSFPSPKWAGAQTFYYPGRRDGELLAFAIQNELVRSIPGNTRRAQAGEYFVLERAPMPAVVVEVGFLSNPKEEELLRDAGYQGELASAIFRGVMRYLLEAVARNGAGRIEAPAEM